MVDCAGNTSESAKRIWATPAIDVVASLEDVSMSFLTDIDEDFTGDPLNS